MFVQPWNLGFRLVVLLLGLWLAFDLASHLVAEILWFQEVGYLPAFLLRLKTQMGLWTIASFLTATFLLGNLALARRLKYPKENPESPLTLSSVEYSSLKLGGKGAKWKGETKINTGYSNEGDRTPDPSPLTLRWLLLLVLVLGLLVALMILHYGQVALGFWHPDFRLPTVTPALPTAFRPSLIWQLLGQQVEIPSSIWQVLQHPPVAILRLILLVGIAIAVIVNPQFWLTAIAVGLSLFFGQALSANWGRLLQYFHPTTFNNTDPLFGKDISVYIFALPVWQLMEFWLNGLFFYALVAVTLIYLLSGDSLSQGQFIGFSQKQLRHLSGLGGAFMLAIALRYWLNRYELLYSSRGVAYGASYTDVRVQLPLATGISLLAGAIALSLLWRTVIWHQQRLERKKGFLIVAFFVFTVAFIADSALPAAVQRFAVQPNELAREQPYIERSIAFTRQAFALKNIEVKTFNPQGELTAADIQRNNLTIDNIRLWDTRPLLQTNRQLQQIRLYYKFPGADIDRYTLKQSLTTPRTAKQQAIIAARELDYSAVPQQAKTWVNEHLIYTHGYGFTLSPVNRVAPGGLPDYYVKDIGTDKASDSEGSLRTSSDRIRASIPIGKPRIYYGEITDTYVMTGTKVKEFDYPSGDDNFYNTYHGSGGVAINSLWRRWLFANYLNDWQMLLTRNITPQTKLLFRRNIAERVRAIAPMLRYDSDPYLVVADANPETQDENYLYWIIDAYTTSDRYPYSDPGKENFNYIRNSVKVVIDAYHGSVNFYIADTQDPIIQSWNAIFPRLFKPLNAMPATLLSHIRYPVDLFSIQSERLLNYHMTDPQVFYNREDQWQIPNEIYGSKPQPVEPYYLIMKLPTAPTEEFILLLPFTPTQRNNLIAWLAARSDGEEYGKLLLYQFPKQVLIYGPEQIEALINQDPVISQQISLWNRQGSRAIQGNLLVIPIEQCVTTSSCTSTLLYVEPLYLEAAENSLPTLVRVIVAYENRIVMAQTLSQALQAIFQSPTQTTPAIVRPLQTGGYQQK